MGTVIKNSSHNTKTGLISNASLAKRVSSTGSSSDKVVQNIDAVAKKAGTFDQPQTFGTTVGAPDGYAINQKGQLEKLAGVESGYNALTAGAGPDKGVSYANGAIQSTQGMRADQGAVKSDAASLLGLIGATNGDMDNVLASYLGMESFGDSKEGKKKEDQLSEIFNSINKITPDQQAKIDAEGAAVGGEFDSAISSAEQEKQQGMAKNIVGAGERGGFMNTQFAGVGALLPTEGGTFVGTGGELNRLKSEYDAQINNLRSQKVIAVNKAVAAAREAAITGNRQLFNDAVQFYNIAKDNHNEAVSMIEKKINLVNTIQQQQRNDAQQNLQYMLNTFGAGAFDDNIDALKTAAAQAGYDPELFAKGIQTLKEKKQLGELREVSGSLYNITYDKNGQPVAKLIIAKSGGGSGSGGTSGVYSQDQLMDPEIQSYADRVERGEIGLNSVPTSTKSSNNKREMVRIILDQRKESISMTGVGNAPKSQTQIMTVVKNEITKNVGSDGYVNPSTYTSLRNDIVKNYPELLGWYDKTYPKSKWISPDELKSGRSY